MDLSPRQLELLEEVRRARSVSVEALAERFGVTLQTVRRDVRLLAEAGLLARFHGGVRLPSSTTENIAYRQRQALNDDAKRCIARAVAQAVPNGCSLLINIGTTTVSLTATNTCGTSSCFYNVVVHASEINVRGNVGDRGVGDTDPLIEDDHGPVEEGTAHVLPAS